MRLQTSMYLLPCVVISMSVLLQTVAAGTVPYSQHHGLVNDEDSTSHETPATNNPQIVSTSQQVSAHEGSTVTLPCAIKDLGPYVVLWKKSLSTILYAGNLQVLKDTRFKLQGHNLLIHGVKQTDAGQYTCQVSHQPPVEVVHTLTVEKRPVLVVTPPTSTDTEGLQGGSTGAAPARHSPSSLLGLLALPLCVLALRI